ncbi:P27 family phage terminase small subunit [Paenibacillus sp. GCM10023248]|uniref:P27 family phage terminase small subunit n=1 Tax=unclassified Paenibacillus TaxID=185978 RepID=UPI002378EE22|nr:P27 family phage terminase small subunit [Paenibacillus sp. MAHUQ-63]MDD9266063.1 P27 family phage terminase small subunit [Paenibacillus sp. MAHUQ-63]
MFKPKTIITTVAARELFKILVRELEIDNNLSERTIMLVDNMVLLEQLKRAHIEDIKKRGSVELFKNGTQEMYRSNKSVDAVLKIVEQQRKLQAELKLTPASDRKVAGLVKSEGGDNDGDSDKRDEFEKF